MITALVQACHMNSYASMAAQDGPVWLMKSLVVLAILPLLTQTRILYAHRLICKFD